MNQNLDLSDMIVKFEFITKLSYQLLKLGLFLISCALYFVFLIINPFLTVLSTITLIWGLVSLNTVVLDRIIQIVAYIANKVGIIEKILIY